MSKLLPSVLLAGVGPKLNPLELDLSPLPNELLPVVMPDPNTPNEGVLDAGGILEKGLGLDETGAPLDCPKRLLVVAEVLDEG